MVDTQKKALPCGDGLTADCFKQQPAFARRAFAYRLLHTITPKPLTKKLPEIFRRALVAKGIKIPPGWSLPPGAVVPPGAELPIDAPGPGEMPVHVLPPPAQILPPGSGGTAPPLFVPPWTPGPVDVPGKNKVSSPAGGVALVVAALGNTSLGYDNAVWLTARNQVSASNLQADVAYATMARASVIALNYDIIRYFAAFDLSAAGLAGATVKAVSLLLCCAQMGDGKSLSVQQGTQSDPVITGDYDEFTGDSFANTEIVIDVYPLCRFNELVFNAGGIAYIQSVIDGTAKLCVREYTHDYLNEAPAAANQVNAYWAKAAGDLRPRLSITY